MEIKIIKQLDPYTVGMGIQAVGSILGMMGGREDREQQLKQQQAFTNMQKNAELDIWNKTNYSAQVEHAKKAGLNPAMLYGKGGAGGQLGNISGGQAAPTNQSKLAGMSMIAELGTMLAQKELIKAQTKNTEMDTAKKNEEQFALAMENSLRQYGRTTDVNGNDIGGDYEKSAEVKKYLTDINTIIQNKTNITDDNLRKNTINNKELMKLDEEIRLLKKKNLTEDEIKNNLQKEGKIKDAAVSLSELGLAWGDIGKIITALIFKN